MSRQVKKRTAGFCISILAVLSIFSVCEVTWVGAANPEARVVSVQHPDHVFPGDLFQVTVVVEYSDKFLVDVGIWDPGAGEIVRSVTLISSFTGPGEARFMFQLTAPSSEGLWNLTAMTRIWWQDAWYQDPNGGTLSFAIATIAKSNEFRLTVSSKGADTSIRLDAGTYQIRSPTSLSLQLPSGIHVLEANSTIPRSLGERFVFTGWSDGVNSNPRQILITQNTDIAAIYRTEYYLSAISDVNKVSGTGWYEQGSLATFAVDPSYTVVAWFGYVTYQYDFSRWSGDSNSTSNVSSVMMNQPKSVKAEWVLSGTMLRPILIAYALLLACVPLVARVIYLRSKRAGTERKKRTGTKTNLADNFPSPGLISLLLLTIVLVASLNVPTVNAEFTMQPNASIVRIGDATWYYWNQTASDTCILWLGGGITVGTAGGDNYWINPFQYESFGTVQFIQNLARYYCVIALQQGADKSFSIAANRTIFQEAYSIQSTIIADVHNWITKQGYEHTYIVGYSVGGQAGAIEVTLRDPKGWTSADGLVLITVPLSLDVIDSATNIHPNLLFLYGGNVPDYAATGQDFYNNAPAEGWHATYYYHKEFAVLQDAGHEVWTERDTGAYAPQTLNLMVSFIERSKALQFTRSISSTITSTLNLTSVNAPSEIAPDQAFFIDVAVRNPSPSDATVALTVFSSVANETVSSAIAHLAADQSRMIRLVIPPIFNTSQQSIDLVLLQKVGDKWVRTGATRHVIFTDLFNLTIHASVPNVTVDFDGVSYKVPAAGTIQFEAPRGPHSIQVQPVIEFGNGTRTVFTEWGDQTTSPRKQFFLDNDTVLSVIYRRQYFVTVMSPYSTTAGSGWYDEKSTAAVLIQPLIDSRAEVIFSHWSGDSASSDPRTLLSVNSPKTVMANWDSIRKPTEPESSTVSAMIMLSLGAFAILSIWNLRKRI
jgi:hypothetical protein